MRKLFLYLLTFILFYSCIIHKHPIKKEVVQNITLDTINVVAKKGAPVYRAKANKVWAIKHTRIALTFNWKDKTADAKEWIYLHPYFYATDTITLDAKSMRIDTVQLVTQNGNTNLKYVYENDVLKIYLGKQYEATDSIELYLKYTAMPYSTETGGSKAITDDRGLYFINTDNAILHKPAQIWTQGESESNSHWLITIDKPNTRFTTQIELTVPDTMTTLSNGALIAQNKAGNRLRTDIWRMDMPIQAYVAMFAIGKFSVIPDNWRGKEVNYYVEPEFATYARQIFKYTPEMMECFSKKTGVPFPWNKYDQVIARDYVSGAMENTTAALFGEFMNRTPRELADYNGEDVVAHELFHEWFGDYATCASWSNLTVNESFANYGEQLWRTYKYGKASAQELAFNDLDRYLKSSQYADRQLVRYYYESQEEMFDGVSYNKGGAILHYINNLAGDAGFDKAMQLYLTKNALHDAEARDWQHAVEEATGQDWNWFFNQWYYHAGHPVLSLNYNYNDTKQRLEVVVKQTQNDSPFYYTLPLKAGLLYGDNKTIIDWVVDKPNDTFFYAYKGGQQPVFVPDYDHVLPGEIIDHKKPEHWLAQITHCDDFANRRLALAASGLMLSDSVLQLVIDRGLNDKLGSIRKNAISEIKGTNNTSYHKRFGTKITTIAKNDDDNLVRAQAFNLLSAWKDTAAKNLMQQAVFDSSYAVAGEALDGLKKIDTLGAYTIAKNLVNTNPKAYLETQVWAIIGNKAADEDIALYQKYGEWMLASNSKYAFLNSLNTYFKKVKNEAAFITAVNIYVANMQCVAHKVLRSRYGMVLCTLAETQKDNLKADSKEDADTAQKRLDIIKTKLQQLIANETEKSVKEDYEKKMKAIYGA